MNADLEGGLASGEAGTAGVEVNGMLAGAWTSDAWFLTTDAWGGFCDGCDILPLLDLSGSLGIARCG